MSHSTLMKLVITVMIMSAADAALTLEHIIRGVATEWNPVMSLALQNYGVGFSVLAKALITGFGLIALAHFYNKVRLARIGLWLVAALYCILTMYHLCIVLSHY